MASFLGAFSIAAMVGPSGRQTQIGLGGVSDNMFANFLKNGNHSAQPGLDNNYPSRTNDSGYPTTTSSLSQNTPDGIIWQVPPGYTGNVCIFWTGQGAVSFDPGGAIIPRMTVIEDNQGLVLSSSYSFNASGTMNGTTHRIIIAFNVDSTRIAFNFPSGQAYSQTTQMSKLVICRAQDEALCRASENAFFPPYIAVLNTLKPHTIRVMDVTSTNNSNRAQSKYDPPATSVSFGSDTFSAAINVGSIAGSTVLNVDRYTCGSYSDMNPSWTDKEQFQGIITFSNSSPNATINVNGRGPKKLVNIYLSTPQANTFGTTTLASFTYDAFLDVVFVEVGGFRPTVPLSILIDLANTIGSDLWLCLPHLTDDSSVATASNLMLSTLNNRGMIEYSNEIWNFGYAFQQSRFAVSAGAKMGVVSSPNACLMSWYAKRAGEIGRLVKTARGASTKVQTVLACQGYSASSTNDFLRFQGLLSGDGSPPIQITNISNGTTPIVSTSSPHQLTANEVFVIQGNAESAYAPVSGMTIGADGNGQGPINGVLFSVGAVINATSFTLKRTQVAETTGGLTVEYVAGSSFVDTTSFGTYISGGYIFKTPKAPNRLIDACDVISYATYYYGRYFKNTNYDSQTSDLALLYSKAVANDLDWLDDDFRFGHSGQPGNDTIQGFATNVAPGWNALAGKYSKSIELYEGALEMAVPHGGPENDQWTALGQAALGSQTATFQNQTFVKNGHGLTSDTPVCLYGNDVPAPFKKGEPYGLCYYPVSITTNSFKLSASKNGLPISAENTDLNVTLYYSKGSGICMQFLRNYKNDARFYTAMIDAMASFKSGSNLATKSVYSWYQLFGPAQWSCWDGTVLSNSPHQSFLAMATTNNDAVTVDYAFLMESDGITNLTESDGTTFLTELI